jgi:putative ABC transport system permease protein
LYKSEQKLGQTFTYFALISLFITCLGLFSLSLFTVRQRTKEIGIRKLLGSSVAGIFLLITKESANWILMGNIIAWPIAYFAMHKWLENFAYLINIGLGTFLISGTITLVIALLTVSYQSIKAASANPADSLRHE